MPMMFIDQWVRGLILGAGEGGTDNVEV